MAEHVDDVATYVSGEDTSELAKTKAELAYALSCLDREITIRTEADFKNEALVGALAKAVKFYDGVDAPHHPGEAKLLDELTAVLASVGSPTKGEGDA